MLRVCAVAAAVALGSPVSSAPKLHSSAESVVVLGFRPLNARLKEPSRGIPTLEVEPNVGGRTLFDVVWPDPDSSCRVEITAEERPPLPGVPHVVRIQALVTRPDGTKTRADRMLHLQDVSTTLFEVLRVDGRALTLAIEAEVEKRTVFSTTPSAEIPVRLLLDIEWVEGGEATSLETNSLQTFLGESVGYSFRLGPTGDAESAEIRLTPVRLFADVLSLEVEVSGTLPDGEQMTVQSRKKQLLINSGSTSSMDLLTGDSSRGFRFKVTPRF